MKIARGSRPWPIRLFAGLFLFAAGWQLIFHLTQPLAAHLAFPERFPAFEWTEDWVIVASFTEFTIALIPIVWIYFLASRVARWFVTIFGVFKMMPASFDSALIALSLELNPSLLVPPIAIILALALLFTPGASAWFARQKEVEIASFR